MDDNNMNSPFHNSDTSTNEAVTDTDTVSNTETISSDATTSPNEETSSPLEQTTIKTYSEPVRSAFEMPDSHPTPATPQPSSYQNGNYYYNTAPVEEVIEPGNGFAITSLVLGIISILTTCCCGLGILLGILGIIFGCIQQKDSLGQKPGMAILGIVLSGIGTALSFFALIAIMIPMLSEM